MPSLVHCSVAWSDDKHKGAGVEERIIISQSSNQLELVHAVVQSYSMVIHRVLVGLPRDMIAQLTHLTAISVVWTEAQYCRECK